MAKTESAVWADCKDPSDGNEPYYYDWRDWGYGEWLNTSENGTNTLGWWCTSYGSDLGGIKIEYPSDAAVDKLTVHSTSSTATLSGTTATSTRAKPKCLLTMPIRL